jgi:hypothetical protein
MRGSNQWNAQKIANFDEKMEILGLFVEKNGNFICFNSDSPKMYKIYIFHHK